jgi:steroid 5-alpha reductase family enzyme
VLSPFEQLALETTGVLVVMFAVWLIQLRFRDAGVVDAAWTASVGLAALFLAWTSDGDIVRRTLLALVSALWSFRLAFYLLTTRVFGQKGEEARYHELRRRWGQAADRNMLIFFLLQGILVVVLSLPFLVVAHSTAPGPNGADLIGLAVGLVAVLGEAIADRQLATFRQNPANRGTTCRDGLWRYSRHPNYFFEWLHWWAYVLLGLASPWWFVTLVGPALMLFLILNVTGIPATEKRALASRGDDYRRYQKTTNRFFPWFPRRISK